MFRADVTVNLNVPGAQGALNQEVDRLIRQVKLAAEGYAKVDAPVRTGFYKANIRTIPKGLYGGATYSLYVERRRHVLETAVRRAVAELPRGGR